MEERFLNQPAVPEFSYNYGKPVAPTTRLPMPTLYLLSNTLSGPTIKHAMTNRGHWVIFYYGEAVAVLRADGLQFKRNELLTNWSVAEQARMELETLRSQLKMGLNREIIGYDDFHWRALMDLLNSNAWPPVPVAVLKPQSNPFFMPEPEAI